MFDERGAMLDPVAVVDVDDAAVIVDAAVMNVAAYVAVVTVGARRGRDARFEVADEAPRGADARLQHDRQRSVVQTEPAQQRVASPVRCADETLQDVAETQQPCRRGACTIVLVAVTDAIAATVRGD